MFKFLERKRKEALVLISGWAFDYRIFDTLDLPYNYIFFCGGNVLGFEDNLKETLTKNNIKRVSLFGWSQGAFLASDFAAKNPGIVDEVILVSIRKKYDGDVVENIKRYLSKNRKPFLYKFYRDCFCDAEAECFAWFRKRFLKYYLYNTELEGLVGNLDWLSRARIQPGLLKELRKIKIIHGRKDRIAPVEEAQEIKNSLPRARLIIFEDTGHLPFLRRDFSESLYRE